MKNPLRKMYIPEFYYREKRWRSAVDIYRVGKGGRFDDTAPFLSIEGADELHELEFKPVGGFRVVRTL